MKKPKEILNRFPSECCNEYITGNGVCIGCFIPIEETKQHNEQQVRKQQYEYEEIWRKAFDILNEAIDDVYGKHKRDH